MAGRRKKTATELRFEAFKESRARAKAKRSDLLLTPERRKASKRSDLLLTPKRQAQTKIRGLLTPGFVEKIGKGLQGKFDKEATSIADPSKKKRKRR